MTLVGDFALELLVSRHQTAETVLESNSLLVFLLGILESLGLGFLVSLYITFALVVVISAQVLELLLSVGTLEMVDSLGGESELLAHLVLLLLKSLELDLANAVGVEVVDVEAIDINTLDTLLKFLELAFHLLSLDLLLLLSDTASLTLTLVISQTLDFGGLQFLLALSLLLCLLALLGSQSASGSLLHLCNDL